MGEKSFFHAITLDKERNENSHTIPISCLTKLGLILKRIVQLKSQYSLKPCSKTSGQRNSLTQFGHAPGTLFNK